jgi:hypothetical protein
MPVEDAILRCPMCVQKLGVVVQELFGLVRRVLESWADVAVWEARHLVAKLHVCDRESRAIDVAERRAAQAEVAGLMAAIWC